MLIKKLNQRKNKAVAPVIATLLMIAVAVAMSVIIFMWSQGFLSQTSESTGSQQGSQNQAAQSSIAIEVATFKTTGLTRNVTVIVRNVGAVAVSIGSITLTGLSSNANFTGSVLTTVSTTGSIDTNDIIPSGNKPWTSTTTDTLNGIGKGSSVVIKLGTLDTGSGGTSIASGDVITIKITTDKGTFSQQSFTVS